MRFALLGDHPDGLGLALALHCSGRHVVTAYTGPPRGLEYLRGHELAPRPVGDVEEVLADPAIEAVIVAGPRADRPAQLRRTLQSERHALCVHPADERPDIGYEAALLQTDARVVLLPLLPEARHPAVARVAELIGRQASTLKGSADSSLGVLRLVEVERWSAVPTDTSVPLASLPGWDVLRRAGGEIAEVSAVTCADELTSAEPVLLAGRFAQGGLFRALFLPGRSGSRVRLAILGSHGDAELLMPEGWSGPARLQWTDSSGRRHDESYLPWVPWPALVEQFEAASAATSAPATWQDELRALELDDAVRRSLRYRRVSTLEYPEASEEVGFKGTMTLVGCALLWLILLLAILSRWVPWLGWLVVPALVIFLGMQVLRWAVPKQ